MGNSYTILGIHGADVLTVNEYAIPNNIDSALIKEHNVARVRMFIGDKIVDEDFDLPEVPPAVPMTQEVYDYFLSGAIKKRMEELLK